MKRVLLLGPLIILSGCAALIYELVWFRVLDLLFGVSSQAAATTLFVFMLGLGVGASAFGARADRRGDPWMLFVRLEIATGLMALLGFWLAWHSTVPDRLIAATYDVGTTGRLLVRIALASALLLPSTLCMGGTLPVLARALAETDQRLGARYAWLYYLNTIGAAAGAALAGFVLVRRFGVTRTFLVAVGISLAVGLLAWLLRTVPRATTVPATPDARPATPRVPSVAERAMPTAVTVTGIMLMAYEVTWMRIMTNFGEGTSYALTAILVAVLVGLAVGGAAAVPVVDRLRAPAQAYASGLALVTLVCAATLFLLGHSSLLAPLVTRLVLAAPARWQLVLGETAAGSLLIGIVSAGFGFLFPLAVRVYAPDARQLGAQSGRLHLRNALGLAVGSLLAGFVFLPLQGTSGAHGWLVGLGLGSAAWMAWLAREPGRHQPGALAVAVWLASALGSGALIRATPDQFFRKQADQFVCFHAEGRSATVTVLGTAAGSVTNKILSIDGQAVSGDYPIQRADAKLLAHLPLLLSRHRHTAATVGFGTGGTSHSMRLHGAEVTAIEIEPRVLDASPQFAALNQGVLQDPGFHVAYDDARHFLANTTNRFDVIVSDVTNAKYKRNASLYAVDYFEAWVPRLAPGGVAATWITYAGLSPEDVRMIVASFDRVFAHTTIWAMSHRQIVFLLVVGTPERLRVDLPEWNRRAGEVQGDLATMALDGNSLAGFLLLGEADVDLYVAGAARNTDEHPHLEYSDLGSYNRLSHWPIYDQMMGCQEEDLLAYFAGSDQARESVRAALRTARELTVGFRNLF